MTEPKFTKGKWEAKVCDTSIKTALIYLSDKGGFSISDAPDCIANAHLIATAPEMYRMLELAISLMDGDSIEDFTYQYKEISDLLAKARGEK